MNRNPSCTPALLLLISERARITDSAAFTLSPPAHVRKSPGVYVVDDDVEGRYLFLAVGFQNLFGHELNAHAAL